MRAFTKKCLCFTATISLVVSQKKRGQQKQLWLDCPVNYEACWPAHAHFLALRLWERVLFGWYCAAVLINSCLFLRFVPVIFCNVLNKDFSYPIFKHWMAQNCLERNKSCKKFRPKGPTLACTKRAGLGCAWKAAVLLSNPIRYMCLYFPHAILQVTLFQQAQVC